MTASWCARGTSSPAPPREPDFRVRHGLDAPRLTELIGWSAEQFEQRMRGSAIHRIGYARWLRNIAVALGNARTTPAVLAALEAQREHPLALVREHVQWALARHREQSQPRARGSASSGGDAAIGAQVVDQARASDTGCGQHHQLGRRGASAGERSTALRIEK